MRTSLVPSEPALPRAAVALIHSNEAELLPSTERSVLSALAHLLVMVGVKHGLEPDVLCGAAFRVADLADRDRQVPYTWLLALARALARSLPERSLAAEVARFASLDHFGYLGLALKHADSPRDALEILVRYAPLLDSQFQLSELAIEFQADTITLVIPQVQAEPAAWREAILAGALAILRATGSGEVKPREVRLGGSARPLHPELERLFDAPVGFGGADDRCVFDRAMLERLNGRGDAAAMRHFAAQSDKLLDALAQPFVTLVTRSIAGLLVRGQLSQRAVGKSLALSPRSLQRKLRQHGVTYNALVQEAREAVAARMLLEPSRSICEIASALGYHDVSSFTRIFKRWTGISPSRYRDKQRTQNES